jgi:Domain of unknown function (DUF4167)
MRPNMHKRMRNGGNNNNHRSRRGQNSLNRTFESNGPDVKVRGTATQVAEKYVQLARDAASSGDRVLAESYLQHAEHYFRLIATAQQQMNASYTQPTVDGVEAVSNDDESDDVDDTMDDVINGFAPPRAPVMDVQNHGHQGGYDRNERFASGREDHQPHRLERQDRPDRPRRFDRPRFDRSSSGVDGQDQPVVDAPVYPTEGRDVDDSPRRSDRFERGGRDRFQRGPRPQAEGSQNGSDENTGSEAGVGEGRFERPRRFERPKRFVQEDAIDVGLPAFLTAAPRPIASVEPVASAPLSEEANPKPRRASTRRPDRLGAKLGVVPSEDAAE